MEEPTIPIIPITPKPKKVLTPEQLEQHRKRSREGMKKYYSKHKDEPEFKAKQRGYFKSWLERNRAHFNEICRERNRLRAAALRQKWRAEGTCNHCGQPRASERKFCAKCLSMFAKSKEKCKQKQEVKTESKEVQNEQ